jgi:hypothetical protein
MKKVLLFLTTITLFCSCGKSDEKEYTNRYTGKWKLMNINLTGELSLIGSLNPPIVDYSETDIIYEFKRGGVMTVSGEATSLDLDWYAEHGLLDLYLNYEIGTGVHSYVSTFLVDNGWCAWDLKVDAEVCRLIVSEDMSLMTINKTVSYEDLPLAIKTRTSPSPSVMFVFQLEKVEELLGLQ